MKFAMPIPNVQPDKIQYHFDLLRRLKYKVITWIWFYGVLVVYVEKPRFKVKMKFKNVADYHQTLIRGGRFLWSHFHLTKV